MNDIHLILIMIILPIIAQIGVKLTFRKYSRVSNFRGITAEQAARMILDSTCSFNYAAAPTYFENTQE